MHLEQAFIEQNNLMREVLNELRSIKNVLSKSEIDTCTPKEACILIGLNNTRYLTYYHGEGVLNRRKGGNGYLYYKNECKQLADKIRLSQIVVPSLKEIYSK